MGGLQSAGDTAGRIVDYLANSQAEMVGLLRRLVLAESPSDVAEAQASCLSILQESLQEVDYHVELIAGRQSGGHLLGRPKIISAGSPRQLLLGHCDTVWPIGTLKHMPFEVDGDIVRGPGVYDMKSGLAQMVFALKALHDLDLSPSLVPTVLINSDEELSSFESEPAIIDQAKASKRVYVLEPSLGPEGKLKTARKGVGRFQVNVTGVAAHAGLDPEKGRSAILELAYVIQQLFALNDPVSGVSVNVGLIEGGLRPNVIAPTSRAEIDVRAPTGQDAQRIERAILSIRPATEGAQVKIEGAMSRGPLERTPANRALWRLAQEAGASLGIELEQGMAGGGSDGNTTSQFTATLDGLGGVGDGAHAKHEFIYLDKMVERAALLAMLLMAPGASDM